MNTIFLLLVTITIGSLKGARPGEGEGREGSGQSAQAARDAAALAREAQEQAARDAASEKPLRGGWSRSRPGRGIPASEGGLRGDGQQGKRPGSAGSKSGGDDGDTQATELAQKARGVVEDPFNLNETGAPTPATGRRDEGVTPEDIATRILEGGVADLEKTARELVDSSLLAAERIEKQLGQLKAEAIKFERTGKSSSSLTQVAKDVNAVTDLLKDRGTGEIKVVPTRSGELKISSGGEAVRTKPIAISFMPKGIIGKIKFCWNRYKLKSALKSYSDGEKIVKLANAVHKKLGREDILFSPRTKTLGPDRGNTWESVNKQTEEALGYIIKYIDAAVGLDWRNILFEK